MLVDTGNCKARLTKMWRQEKKDVNLEMKENQPLLVLLQSEPPIKESHAVVFYYWLCFQSGTSVPGLQPDRAHPGKGEKIWLND